MSPDFDIRPGSIMAVYPTTPTLRDEFAMRALAGMMGGRIEGKDMYTADADQWAEIAYEFADAMLRAREPKTPTRDPLRNTLGSQP